VSTDEGESRKTELFGSAAAPKARWSCACGQRCVTSLAVPIRAREPVVCRRCRRASMLSFIVPRDEAGQAPTEDQRTT
jgi:hypothetical protein